MGSLFTRVDVGKQLNALCVMLHVVRQMRYARHVLCE
jgi:hypothetical protein